MSPMPSVLNVELLIKLMGMTTSSVDGEALAALRAANRLLITNGGGSWDTLLRGKLAPIDPFASLPEPPKAAPQTAKPYTPPPSSPPLRCNRGVDKKEQKIITAWLVTCEFGNMHSSTKRQIDLIESEYKIHKAMTDNHFGYLRATADCDQSRTNAMTDLIHLTVATAIAGATAVAVVTVPLYWHREPTARARVE